MTTSNDTYVWVWLPNAITPVVAGKLESVGKHFDFYYGKFYLENENAIALSPFELPLIVKHRFTSANDIHFVIRDSLPDAWGRRVLQQFYADRVLDTLDLLLLSSSDRIGALHFQTTSDTYIPNEKDHITLEQLDEVAHLVEQGKSIPRELDMAINHGTSIGGARPKATIDLSGKKFIAKFSSSQDVFPLVQAEFAAMTLARKIGLQVANTQLVKVNKKWVLLVERFDRVKIQENWTRRMMLSGLTALSLTEFEGRYASYLDLADVIRKMSTHPKSELEELYRRMVFNILIGNTDDHAKNHAFFWDGKYLTLTPAYDICPFPRAGQEATQAMQVGKMGAFSQLKNALSGATMFELNQTKADEIIDESVDKVRKLWATACEEAQLTSVQQKLLNSSVLNPFIFL